jgi:hypothetical protein
MKTIRRPYFDVWEVLERGEAHWAHDLTGRPWAGIPESTEDPKAMPVLASAVWIAKWLGSGWLCRGPKWSQLHVPRPAGQSRRPVRRHRHATTLPSARYAVQPPFPSSRCGSGCLCAVFSLATPPPPWLFAK